MQDPAAPPTAAPGSPDNQFILLPGGRVQDDAYFFKSDNSTKVTSFQLGANYWHSRRLRATFNYVLNTFGGDNVNVARLKKEQELLFRLAIAL